jgi:hypothetical protein
MRLGVLAAVVLVSFATAAGAHDLVEVPQQLLFDPVSRQPIDIGVTGSMTSAEIQKWVAAREREVQDRRDAAAADAQARSRAQMPAPPPVTAKALEAPPSVSAAASAVTPSPSVAPATEKHRNAPREVRHRADGPVPAVPAKPAGAAAKPAGGSAFDDWLLSQENAGVPRGKP